MAQLELDRTLQGLTQDFNKFRASWTQTMTGVQKTFVQAETTIKGMIASAGGSVWTTLTGSLELVGIQLTSIFIPTIITAAQALQDFADFLKSLTPEQKKMVTYFAEVAGGAFLVKSALSMLGISVHPVIGGFALMLIAAKGFADWVDSKIEERHQKFVEAAGQQYTRAEVQSSAEYAQVQAISGKDARNAFIQNQLATLAEQIKESQKSKFEGGWMNPGMRFGPTEETNKLLRQQAMYSSVRRDLVFGETLPETVAGASKSGGLGKATLQNQPGGKGGLKIDWPKEMQPRFSAVEEARKQFQIQALKSPLEQQLMQDLRNLAQQFIQEAGPRTRMQNKLAGENIGGLGK